MLQDNSLVVSLSVCIWSARKLDRKVTDEVNKSHNASDDAGRYNKLLVSKEHLDKVQKVMGEARIFHYENTLPWGDNNERLLPASNYFDYIAKMAEYKGKFDKEAQEFIDNYDKVIEEAKIRLNGMFREADYPNRQEIVNKFAFKNSFMPVPDTDFRIKLKEEEVQKLKEQLQTEVTNRLEEAVKDTWTRIKDQLVHMRDRLRNPDAIFRDSLFNNLKELVGLLPKLNVTNDDNLNMVCAEMSSIIVHPESVRQNPDLRQIKADEVDQVLNKFNQFF